MLRQSLTCHWTFIVALQDIDEDEELFCIPLSCVLTTKKSDLSQIRPHILDRLDPWNALVLVMIYEHGKGMTSTWWPYLNILPTDFDTLIYWSPLELAELQGSAVIDKIGKDDADHEFICSLLPLIKESPSIFGIYGELCSCTMLSFLSHLRRAVNIHFWVL